MEVLSWNIQAGRGVDGNTDLHRIITVVREMGDPDVMCFQEVARYFPALDDGRGEDQAALIMAAFPSHQAFFGPALDRIGSPHRARFGNMLLSRLPVLQNTFHKLPQPVDSSTRNMPRQAIEAIVHSDVGAVRIVTTHLEYFSGLQRLAQVRYLRAIYDESRQRADSPVLDSGQGPYTALAETKLSVFCGDFNFVPESPEYAVFAAREREFAPLDAWRIQHGERIHPPTCGVFDREQWPQGDHCRDFFFLSPDLKSRVREMTVNLETSASDHQPLRLVLR